MSQLREIVNQFRLATTFCQEAEYLAHGNASATHRGFPKANCGIHDDAIEMFHGSAPIFNVVALAGEVRLPIETANGEFNHGLDLTSVEAFVPLHDVTDVRAGFEVLEDG
jgi:hypothetical protein